VRYRRIAPFSALPRPDPTEADVSPDSPADRSGLPRPDLDRPEAADRAPDLRGRLDRLPPGHPSSPYETDGTPRRPLRELPGQDAHASEPPADGSAAETLDAHPGEAISADSSGAPGSADLRATQDEKGAGPTDRISPLSDVEWAGHVADVRDGLAGAAADGLVTSERHTIDKAGKIWSAERDAAHESIIEDLCTRADGVPCERESIVAGGLGGAGKSTVLSSHAGIDRSRYMTINPDDVKEEMGRRGLIPDVDGLSPMEASDLVHEESSYIAKRVARRALAEGKNVIWDITMSKQDTTEERIDDLHAAGYSVTGVFVDIPVETSVSRAEARHRAGHEEYRAGIGLGGRYVPSDIILAQADDDWGSQNRKTFEVVRHRFDQWSCYDNSVDGRPPVLAKTSQPDENREETAR
jgi:predicted kinase